MLYKNVVNIACAHIQYALQRRVKTFWKITGRWCELCFKKQVQVSALRTEVSWGLLHLKICVYCNEIEGETSEIEVAI